MRLKNIGILGKKSKVGGELFIAYGDGAYALIKYIQNSNVKNTEEENMENYEGAAVERLKDWEILNKENRKVGTIHFGGIYVECLLKAMICKLSTVADGSKGKWIVNGNEVPRPLHELLNFQYRNLLTDLYDCMPSNVESALRNISKPNGVSYIDYRYRDNLELSDMEYDKWLDDFILVYDFLTEKKREI